jgi:glycosyltransferase involved in cell wall biosynthesis
VVLADHIVVNSEWSRRALAAEGVPEEKLRTVPLVYEASAGAKEFRRVYPRVFDESRPLRVLFLGQVNVRKGLAELLPAMLAMTDLPVEFHFVGPMQIGVPAALLGSPRVRWHGPVSRSVAAEYYREADVFLFPTLSDGFGITQLEAQAWRLPVIASPYCGDVVRHLENGYVLPAVTPAEIEKAIRWMLANPEGLARMSAASGVETRFSLARVGEQFDALLSE